MAENKPICKDKHASTISYSEQSEIRCAVISPLLSHFTLQYAVRKEPEIQGGFNLSGTYQLNIHTCHIITKKKVLHYNKKDVLEADAENKKYMFIPSSTCRTDSWIWEDFLLYPTAGVVEKNTKNTASATNLVHFS
jgi:hypothetical protein